mmetsp:Transcript_80863/g.168785  ORF Transcript_80863/g.168785 Transcript_80863/m.168785 type:complete len:200 (+) Transcript_80863:1460-2059(+)
MPTFLTATFSLETWPRTLIRPCWKRYSPSTAQSSPAFCTTRLLVKRARASAMDSSSSRPRLPLHEPSMRSKDKMAGLSSLPTTTLVAAKVLAIITTSPTTCMKAGLVAMAVVAAAGQVATRATTGCPAASRTRSLNPALRTTCTLRTFPLESQRSRSTRPSPRSALLSNAVCSDGTVALVAPRSCVWPLRSKPLVPEHS